MADSLIRFRRGVNSFGNTSETFPCDRRLFEKVFGLIIALPV